MRQRTISAAAGFSGSLAVFCLTTAFASGRPAPACGFIAGAIATVALARAGLRRGSDPLWLRLCPRGGVILGQDGACEPVFWPVGVTASLICLARTGRGSERRSIWRDGIAPEAFRRIAAYGLWRRRPVPDRADHPELIARKAVTERRTAPRGGWPRGE
jgi:hypothetical protein